MFLSLLAAASSAAATMSNKYIFVRITPDTMVQTIFGGSVGIILSSLLLVGHGHGTLSAGHIFLAVVAGFSFACALMVWLNVVKIGHVSTVGPLRFLAPLFVTILAGIFLGEIFSWSTYLGIALIILGAAALSGGRPSAIKANKALWLAVLSALFLAITHVLTKYLLRFSDPYTLFVYVRLGLFLFTLPLLIIYFGRLRKILKRAPVRTTALLSMGGIFGTSAQFLTTFAASRGPVALVSVLASTTPFFILLFAIFLQRLLPDVYREAISLRSTMALVLVIGVMLLGVALTL